MKKQLLLSGHGQNTSSEDDEDAIKCFIESEHEGFLKKHTLLALTHANNGKPTIKGDNALLYLLPIKMDYETIYPNLEIKTGSELQKKLGSMEITEAKEKSADAQQTIDVSEAQIKEIEASCVGDSSFLTLFSFLLAVFTLLFMCAGEILYQSLSMQALGGGTSLITGIILGTGIFIASTAIGTFSHLAIKKIPNKWLRVLAHFGIIIFVLIVFCSLATLRENYVQTMSNGNYQSHFRDFVAINFFLYLAVYLIIHFWIFPILPRIKEFFQNFARKRKIAKLRNIIKNCEAVIAEIKKSLPIQLKVRMGNMHVSDQHKRLIETKYYQTVHQFIQTSSIRLKYMPDAYLQPIPPLNFPENFDNNNYE